ncbi:MAG: pseudouridine synthase [Microthrixaceae bacterium]
MNDPTDTPGRSASPDPAGSAAPDDGARPEGERLQKVLARAGVASRRVVEEMIVDGRISVNGVAAVLGRRIDPDRDVVEIDGVRVGVRTDAVYYLLNKPLDVVTTASDPQGRTTVVDLIDTAARIVPVGRLDVDTEGLLLLTNDGELVHRLTHPRYGVDKEYLVEVRGTPSRSALRALREGVDLDDGRTSPAKVSLLEPQVLSLVIHEGRNRQVRRMCEHVGHPVVRLVRTRIGPLRDPALGPGAWRPLTTEEVRALERAVGVAGGGGTPRYDRPI